MAASKVSDEAFRFDEEKLDAFSRAKPMLKESAYFKKTKVSASAAMKMLRHAQHGVEQGMARSPPVPIEVMGLMFGHIDLEDSRALVVTDVFPLPVEGSETAVVADNPEVNGYMAQLTDHLEKTRKERLIGWYHSHPFEVQEHSNCFFSAVDVQTQMAWQMQFEQMGDPYFGIVVDPLRSTVKGRPEFGAFRCYPPTHPPTGGMAPDGVVWADKEARNSRWGPTCESYYALDIEYYMSSLSKSVTDFISRDFMWMRLLTSTPMLDRENKQSRASRVDGAADLLVSHESKAGGQSRRKKKESELTVAAAQLRDVAVEQSLGQATQMVKYMLFNDAGMPSRTAQVPAEEAEAPSAAAAGAAGN